MFNKEQLFKYISILLEDVVVLKGLRILFCQVRLLFGHSCTVFSHAFAGLVILFGILSSSRPLCTIYNLMDIVIG